MEEGKVGIFQKIDRAIFGQLEELKSNQNYVKFQDDLAQLDEEVKTVVRLAATAAVFVIPVILVGLISLKVYSLHTQIQTRLDVLGHMNAIINTSSQIALAQRQSLSQVQINGLSDIIKEVSSAAASSGINKSKFKASDFDQSTPFTEISKSEAKIKFKKINHSELAMILNNLIISRKMKISQLKLTRDAKESLLDGEFTIIHYGKNTNTGR
jgi:hypothetical protein